MHFLSNLLCYFYDSIIVIINVVLLHRVTIGAMSATSSPYSLLPITAIVVVTKLPLWSLTMASNTHCKF